MRVEVSGVAAREGTIDLEGTGRVIEVHRERARGGKDVSYILLVPNGSVFSPEDLLDDDERLVAEYRFGLSQPAGAATILRRPAPAGVALGQEWRSGIEWPVDGEDPQVSGSGGTYVLPWDPFWSVLGPHPPVRVTGPADMTSAARVRRIVSPQLDRSQPAIGDVASRARRTLERLPHAIVRGFHEALARYSAELATVVEPRSAIPDDGGRAEFSSDLLATIARGPIAFREALTLRELRPTTEAERHSASIIGTIVPELLGRSEIGPTLFTANPPVTRAQAAFEAIGDESWTSSLYTPGALNPFDDVILPGFDDDRTCFSASAYLSTPHGAQQLLLLTRQRDHRLAGRDVDQAIERILQTDPEVIGAHVGRIETPGSSEVWSSMVLSRERLAATRSGTTG